MSWERISEHEFIDRAAGRNISYQPEDEEYDAFYWLVETATGKTLGGGSTAAAAAIAGGSPAPDTETPEVPEHSETPTQVEEEEVVTEEIPGPGHNSGAPTNVAGERLKSIIDRIERLDEERKALSSDIKDIFAEAKSAGFDTKVLRMLLAVRKLEPAEVEERETLLDVYRRSLGM